MPEYMLILHEPPNLRDLSPEEIQRVVEKYMAWRESLVKSGKFAGGAKLQDEGGKILRSQEGTVTVVDGPYSEAKEVIGGFFTIQAADYEEAVAVSKGCPHLQFGGRIELRQVEHT